MKNKSLLLLVLVGLFCWLPPFSAASDQEKDITLILSLLGSEGVYAEPFGDTLKSTDLPERTSKRR